MNNREFGCRLLLRFWMLVDTAGDCWTWLGKRNKQGYGVFTVGRKNVAAHRFSYNEANGWLPASRGFVVHHTCNNPSCVNPAHLQVLTCRRHLLIGNTFQAKNAAKTHCPRGHPYAGDNLVQTKGGRQCRECRNARRREARAARGCKPKGPYLAYQRHRKAGGGWAIEPVLP